MPTATASAARVEPTSADRLADGRLVTGQQPRRAGGLRRPPGRIAIRRSSSCDGRSGLRTERAPGARTSWPGPGGRRHARSRSGCGMNQGRRGQAASQARASHLPARRRRNHAPRALGPAAPLPVGAAPRSRRAAARARGRPARAPAASLQWMLSHLPLTAAIAAMGGDGQPRPPRPRRSHPAATARVLCADTAVVVRDDAGIGEPASLAPRPRPVPAARPDSPSRGA
jgi:hypothetical protein